LVATLVAALHAGGYYGTRWARSNNLKLRSATPLENEAKTCYADAPLFEQTKQYLARPCGVLHAQACPDDLEESPAILKLKETSEIPSVKRLVFKRVYSTGYLLLKDLAQLHDEHAVIAVSGLPDFTQTRSTSWRLLEFAKTNYLEPALEYAAASRERDAVAAFKVYNILTMRLVKAGFWLSKKGVDLTDLPVLAEAFCTQPDELVQDRALVGLLRAILGTSGELEDGEDIHSAYSALPQDLQVEALRRYLETWSRVHDGSAGLVEEYGSETGGLPTPMAEAAWSYLRGVAAEKEATKGHSKEECLDFMARAREAFESAVDRDKDLLVFAGPARRHLAGIAEASENRCEPSK
jgi:hypothetical protein